MRKIILPTVGSRLLVPFFSRTKGQALTCSLLSRSAHRHRHRGGQVRGVPHELRRQVWLKSSGAADCKASSTSLEYYEIVICAEKLLHDSETMLQIDKDLLRTYPTNIMFDQMSSEGTCRLRRILLATGWCEPEIGYCQGLSRRRPTFFSPFISALHSTFSPPLFVYHFPTAFHFFSVAVSYLLL